MAEISPNSPTIEKYKKKYLGQENNNDKTTFSLVFFNFGHLHLPTYDPKFQFDLN